MGDEKEECRQCSTLLHQYKPLLNVLQPAVDADTTYIGDYLNCTLGLMEELVGIQVGRMVDGHTMTYSTII